jgi:hypothetical protein
VAGNVAPDHSTIAEFRFRHERALGAVFSGVLGLCARAGLASVGVVAIDARRCRPTRRSTPPAISAGSPVRSSPKPRRSTAGDELYGPERGDELPEHLRTREGRRKALREAKERLESERARRQVGHAA